MKKIILVLIFCMCFVSLCGICAFIPYIIQEMNMGITMTGLTTGVAIFALIMISRFIFSSIKKKIAEENTKVETKTTATASETKVSEP